MKTFKQLIETLMNPREKKADMLLRGRSEKEAQDAAYKRRNDLENVQARLDALNQRGRYVPGKERDWAADLSKDRVKNILNRADANLSWSQREGNAPGDASHYDNVNRVQRVARAAQIASEKDMSSVSSSNYAGLTKGLSQNLPPEHPLTGINHRYYRTMAREIEKTPNDPMGAQFKARIAAPKKGKEQWVSYSAGGDSVEEDGLAQDQDSALRGIARGRQWGEDALEKIRAEKLKRSSRSSKKK